MAQVNVSVVMPCLNEEAAVGECVRQAWQVLRANGLSGEVIVVDNGSNDQSAQIAEAAGARVVDEPDRGYGNAYRRGIGEAKHEYVVMADSDGTYPLDAIPRFIELLSQGYDLVMGSRGIGEGQSRASPWLHRYVGVPLLTALLNTISGTSISDAHCGMRAFTKEAYSRMHLQTAGMEFASEMIMNCARAGLKITEVPIDYHARVGESKLRTFSDGWRHLRFLLLYSPTHLFLIPGLFLSAVGLMILMALVWGPLRIWGATFDTHYMLVGSLLSLLGFQVVALGLYGKVYATVSHFVQDDATVNWLLRHFNLERGLLLGLAILTAGMVMNVYIFARWVSSGFGELEEVRLGLLALTLSVVGMQTMFSAFFLSMLGIRRE